MARQRMYLFERAYVDYGARLRNFSRWLMRGCAALWNWFWRGLGATLIEWLLRLLIVASAVAMAVLYVNYEKSHGRPFSVTTFGVICVLVVYALVLLFGWKAPVHFLARVVSGASAAGLMLALSIVAISVAALIFTVYLAALFTLTALSLLIFLPVRAGQELWLLYRRIAYRCPYDDCSYSGLPVHICKCGAQYTDLLPSFYGIFHHKCRHPEGEVKLATMDFLGRGKLARLCGNENCRRPLMHSSLGELPEWPIAIVGGASAGKTVFMLQATREAQKQLSEIPGSKVHLDSERQEQDYGRQMNLLDSGQVVAKTAGADMQALALAVRIPKGRDYLLYLFDKPGEDFARLQRFGQMQALRHLKGIVLLVDPFSLPALADHGQRLNGLKPSEEQFSRIVHTLIQGVNAMLLKRPEDKCPAPLAVVLSKADAFPTRDFPFLEGLFPADGRVDPALSARCREALNKLGAGASVRDLEMKFSNVRYFACTALGRLPDLRNASPFQPKGVVEPLMWLLDDQKQKKSLAAHAAS
ncbi:MAG: hypothetical protein AB7U82_13450 [Blastocatellales bacterium]